jgi:hypothetical protein
VPEWTNGTVSKTVRGASLSGVQIPPLPPFTTLSLCGSGDPDDVIGVDSCHVIEPVANPRSDDFVIWALC